MPKSRLTIQKLRFLLNAEMAAIAIAFTTMPVLLGARSAQAGKTVLIDTVLAGDELVDREL